MLQHLSLIIEPPSPALGLLRALLRRGSIQASGTRESDWPQPGMADMASIAHVTAPDAPGPPRLSLVT